VSISLSENKKTPELDDRAVGIQITTVPNNVSVLEQHNENKTLVLAREIIQPESDYECKYDEEVTDHNIDEHKEDNEPLTPNKAEQARIETKITNLDHAKSSTSSKRVTFEEPLVTSTQILSPIPEGNEEEEIEKVIITFDQLSVIQRERMVIDDVIEKESKYAKLLCIPISIDKQPVGYTLIDPAASRSLIRRSKLRTIKTRNPLIPIKNHYVLSSSGKEIPVTHNIRVKVRSGQHCLGNILFYVVEDSVDNDICCDIVIGRSTLAISPYYHLDIKNGCVYNPKTKETIMCQSYMYQVFLYV